MLIVLFILLMRNEGEKETVYHFLTAYGLLLMQGPDSSQRKSMSIRTLQFSTLFFGFFLFNYFSAILASFLSIRDDPVYVKSDQDILTHKQNLYTLGNSATSNSFKNAKPESPIRKIWDNQVKEQFYTQLYCTVC